MRLREIKMYLQKFNPKPGELSEAALIPTNLPMRPRIRVMLVDESAMFLRAASFFLEQQPEVQVVGAFCIGEQALTAARLLQPQIVLLDLTHSGLPGLRMIARLEAMAPGVRVIVLSLLDIAPLRRAAQTAGAVAFVSKASSRTDLMATIRSVAQGAPKRGQAMAAAH